MQCKRRSESLAINTEAVTYFMVNHDQCIMKRIRLLAEHIQSLTSCTNSG